MTRPAQDNNTQRWLLTNSGAETVTIQQLSTGRYLDVSQDGQRRAITPRKENNDTQRWRLIGFGGGFVKIQQVSSSRVLLGDLTSATDFQVFARNELPPSDQKTWRIADDELIDE